MSNVDFHDIGARAVDRIFPEEDPYAHRPVEWVHERITGFLWSTQKRILESVRDNRFTAVPSCHGPGKSFTASCAIAHWIDTHPPGEAFVITTAPTDSQVKAILWREVGRRRRQGTLAGRITLNAHWYLKIGGEDELVAMGRKPQDYNAEAFQGIHAKYVLVVVDEACGVPKALFDALETLLTNEYCRMLAIGNPDDPASYFETICRSTSGWNVIPISVWDTPNFTGEYVPEDIGLQLVSHQWVEERRTRWGVGSPLWESKVEGRFPEIGDDTLIAPKWVRLAHENELPGLEMGNYGFDIARFGMDETVGYRNRGGVLRKVYSARKQDLVKTRHAIAMHLNSHGYAHDIPAIIDVIGVGGGVVDELRAMNYNVIPFNGSERPMDPRRFQNKRAEHYWKMRTIFEAQEVDLDFLDDDLTAQLTGMKWGINRWGQIYIESKDDMKRRGLPSPDRADASMMALTGRGVLHSGPQVITLPTVTGDLLKKVM